MQFQIENDTNMFTMRAAADYFSLNPSPGLEDYIAEILKRANNKNVSFCLTANILTAKNLPYRIEAKILTIYNFGC